MTYQNIWGLSPEDGSYRSVIGKAVFLQLLKAYPEDLNLASLASREKHPYFQVANLDEWNPEMSLENNQQIKLKELVIHYL